MRPSEILFKNYFAVFLLKIIPYFAIPYFAISVFC